MPVYNKLPFIDAAVESILGQSFEDFEFVILDDGSTDGSDARLRQWAARDRRIRLISGQRSGPVASSNRVALEARAPLIARMDGDDIAAPERLRLQLAVLAERIDAVLVGTLADTIDALGRRLRDADYARLTNPSGVPPFPHASILFRRSAFDAVGGYREQACFWEDIDLSRRMAGAGAVLVIPSPLVSVRVSGASSRLGADLAKIEAAMDSMYREVDGLPAGASSRLLPKAFVPTAALQLWRGQRPRVLPRLLRRGALRFDSPSLRTLLWAAWADASPRTLRQVQRRLLARRNRRARRTLEGRSVLEWLPSGAVGSQPDNSVAQSQGCCANQVSGDAKAADALDPAPMRVQVTTPKARRD
jgi:hypothetical protein